MTPDCVNISCRADPRHSDVQCRSLEYMSRCPVRGGILSRLVSGGILGRLVRGGILGRLVRGEILSRLVRGGILSRLVRIAILGRHQCQTPAIPL